MPRHARWMLLVLLLLAVSAGSAPGGEEAAPRVVATYFHRTLRCQTCQLIESLARHDVTVAMADAVAAGRLSWRLVDFQAEEDARYEERFGLDGPSLVVTVEDGGEVIAWARLDRVWELYDDVPAFDAYVLEALEEQLLRAAEIAAGRSGSREVETEAGG